MKLLKLTAKAYMEYCYTVKGNERTTFDQAKRKLSRNVQLVKEAAPDRIVRGLFYNTYHYGNMKITVRLGKIIKVENSKGKPVKWKFPKERYIELSKEFGITDSKFGNMFVNK
ncbi:hypothetical protein AB1283_01025 [Bacillus sp. S13(2024)]|uniref:hypothetical protein n=1 Tax=Bacillus sp. S13(2024) TaxID=3162885 RepID=UPI003D220A84